MIVVPQLLRVPGTSHWHLPHQGDIVIIRYSLWRVLKHIHLSFIATGAEWKCLDNYPSLFPSPPAFHLTLFTHPQKLPRVNQWGYTIVLILWKRILFPSFLEELKSLSHSWHLLTKRNCSQKVTQIKVCPWSLLRSTHYFPPSQLLVRAGNSCFLLGSSATPISNFRGTEAPLGHRRGSLVHGLLSRTAEVALAVALKEEWAPAR